MTDGLPASTYFHRLGLRPVSDYFSKGIDLRSLNYS